MKKSVLASIKPKYCELIASRKKTVEIRKNRPKIDVPFKCYIYCTLDNNANKPDNNLWIMDKTGFNRLGNGKVIGEFVCDHIDKYEAEFTEDNKRYQDIRLIWKNTDLIVTSNERDNPNDCILCKESCLSFEEIKQYVGICEETKQYIGICFGENFYAWHISDLVIYDKPKELSEFHFPSDRYCKKGLCGGCPHDARADVYGDYDYDCEWKRPLTRPPQSWCYVEELEEIE